MVPADLEVGLGKFKGFSRLVLGNSSCFRGWSWEIPRISAVLKVDLGKAVNKVGLGIQAVLEVGLGKFQDKIISAIRIIKDCDQ